MRKHPHPLLYVIATILIVIMIELGAMGIGMITISHSVGEMELMQSYFYGRRGD